MGCRRGCKTPVAKYGQIVALGSLEETTLVCSSERRDGARSAAGPIGGVKLRLLLVLGLVLDVLLQVAQVLRACRHNHHQIDRGIWQCVLLATPTNAVKTSPMSSMQAKGRWERRAVAKHGVVVLEALVAQIDDG